MAGGKWFKNVKVNLGTSALDVDREMHNTSASQHRLLQMLFTEELAFMFITKEDATDLSEAQLH